MMLKKKFVRILLVGDRGVGKTSLILSLVSEEFPEDVPPRAEEIIIPADVTPEHVPTHIVDYSAVEQDDDVLAEEIRKADVVCIVYALNDANSLHNVTSHWIPFVRATVGQGHSKPIVLVGNKVDLVGQSNYESIVPLMRDYAEIETSVECSAKTLRNLSEMFYYAQKAVLHPAAPLFIPEEESLTSKCEKALIRIFSICDVDNDGALNDDELHAFQRRCFSDPLEPRHLEEVKAVIRRNVTEGVSRKGITLKGFLYLHSLFIQRGRHETTWAVLRKFGYDDNLELGQSFLRPGIVVPQGCTTEMSHIGQDFLRMIFKKYDDDGDGFLSPKELATMFAFCPKIPWELDMCYAVPTNDMGWMSYEGFMCQWAMMILLDVHKAMEYFAHLGFVITDTENQLAAIQITREKGLDLIKRQTARNVYRCHVIGARGAGKTTLCHGFLGRSMEKVTKLGDTLPAYVMNMVQVYGQEKYLLLQDIEVHNVYAVLLPSEVQCDVACLVYDASNPKSFESVAKIYLKYFKDSKVPVLIVANKSDLCEVRQDYILQPVAFTQQYKLALPQPFTSVGSIRKELYVKLATMAAFPHLRRLIHVLLMRPNQTRHIFKLVRHLKQLGLLPPSSLTWLKAGIGLAVVTAVGFLLARVFKFHNR